MRPPRAARRRRFLPALPAILLGLLLAGCDRKPALPEPADTAADSETLAELPPAERADRILARGDYQRAFPEGPEEESGDSFPMPAWLGALLLYLGIGLVLVVLVLLVVLLLRSRLEGPVRRRRTATSEESLPVWARGELGDPRALAEAGSYTEAVHALLLHALRRAIGRSGRRLSDALTAREVVGGLGLHGEPRDALTRLLRASEDTWFGGKPAGPEEFDRCRALYRAAVGPEEA